MSKKKKITSTKLGVPLTYYRVLKGSRNSNKLKNLLSLWKLNQKYNHMFKKITISRKNKHKKGPKSKKYQITDFVIKFVLFKAMLDLFKLRFLPGRYSGLRNQDIRLEVIIWPLSK